MLLVIPVWLCFFLVAGASIQIGILNKTNVTLDWELPALNLSEVVNVYFTLNNTFVVCRLIYLQPFPCDNNYKCSVNNNSAKLIIGNLKDKDLNGEFHCTINMQNGISRKLVSRSIFVYEPLINPGIIKRENETHLHLTCIVESKSLPSSRLSPQFTWQLVTDSEINLIYLSDQSDIFIDKEKQLPGALKYFCNITEKGSPFYATADYPALKRKKCKEFIIEMVSSIETSDSMATSTAALTYDTRSVETNAHTESSNTTTSSQEFFEKFIVPGAVGFGICLFLVVIIVIITVICRRKKDVRKERPEHPIFDFDRTIKISGPLQNGKRPSANSGIYDYIDAKTPPGLRAFRTQNPGLGLHNHGSRRNSGRHVRSRSENHLGHHRADSDYEEVRVMTIKSQCASVMSRSEGSLDNLRIIMDQRRSRPPITSMESGCFSMPTITMSTETDSSNTGVERALSQPVLNQELMPNKEAIRESYLRKSHISYSTDCITDEIDFVCVENNLYVSESHLYQRAAPRRHASTPVRRKASIPLTRNVQQSIMRRHLRDSRTGNRQPKVTKVRENPSVYMFNGNGFESHQPDITQVKDKLPMHMDSDNSIDSRQPEMTKVIDNPSLHMPNDDGDDNQKPNMIKVRDNPSVYMFNDYSDVKDKIDGSKSFDVSFPDENLEQVTTM